jgi:hypothetical protein
VKSTLSWMFSAWLGLTALQLVTSAGGSSKVAGLLAGVRVVVDRALDPNLPAIPDLRDKE